MRINGMFLASFPDMKAPAQIAAALCLMALTTNASATLLTFDEALNLPELLCIGGIQCISRIDTPTYSERGYTFTISGSETPHTGDGTGIDGTLNWHAAGRNSGLLITLTKNGGGLFDLIALDIDVYDGGLGTPTLGVLGVTAPGYLEQTFDRTVDDQALHFIGVSQVFFRIVQGFAVGIDNLLVRPAHQVPEPTTLSLLGIGLAGMGLSRRRKKV